MGHVCCYHLPLLFGSTKKGKKRKTGKREICLQLTSSLPRLFPSSAAGRGGGGEEGRREKEKKKGEKRSRGRFLRRLPLMKRSSKGREKKLLGEKGANIMKKRILGGGRGE